MPFTKAPTIALSLNRIDSSCGANSRILTNASSVTNTGFQLDISTGYDSIIYSVGITWIAYGD